MTVRAGSYARQSRNNAKSIEDQAAENRAAVAEQGWHLAAEYSDGSSASRFSKKVRDDWKRVLADVEAQAIDVLVLWESSRGDRKPETWMALLSLCREKRVRIKVTTHRRTYDLTNLRDWKTLAEDGIDNAYESEKISIRTRRGHASAAVLGRPAQGRAPYGYRRLYDPATGALVGQEPVEPAASTVREVIGRVAAGEPISAIVRDFNERGVPTVNGAKQWYRSRVRMLACNVAYAGLRRHNDETHPAGWEALVSAEDFWAAQRVLYEPARLNVRPGKQRHLLSYLAVCGVCDAGLKTVKLAYRCPISCVSVTRADLDPLVTELVLRRLGAPDVYERLRKVGEQADKEAIAAKAEVARLRADLDKWRRSAARGQTTPESLAVIEGELTAQIRDADRRAAPSLPPELRGMVGPDVDVRERWEAAPIAARRAVIRTLAEIKVHRVSVRGRKTFEPERIEIRWR